MFALLALALAVAWLLGVTMLHITKAGVHMLLVLALVSLIVQLFRARRATGFH